MGYSSHAQASPLHVLDGAAESGSALCVRFSPSAQSAQLLACGTSGGHVLLYDLLELAASLAAGGLSDVPSSAANGASAGALVFKASEEASASASDAEAEALLAIRFSPKECAPFA